MKRNFTLTAILITISVILAAPTAIAAGEVNECVESAFLAAMETGGLVEIRCDGTITLSDEVKIEHDTIIDASGQDVQITSEANTRIFQILREELRVTITGLTFHDGLARTSGGGAILNRGNLTIENSKFVDNRVETGIGGAIHNDGGTLTIRDTEFTTNVAETGGSGGAVANSNAGVLIIEGGSFNTNEATSQTNGRGGAIYGISGKGTITITGTHFNDNVAHGSTEGGGAIYDDGPSTIIIEGATFSYNQTRANGGAIYNKGATTTTSIRDSVFSNNSAPVGQGGAIYAAASSEIAIGNTIFEKNDADVGGAIHASGSENTIIVIAESTFRQNRATHINLKTFEGGGAISNEGTLTITRSTFDDNEALEGSGGAIANHEKLIMINTTMTANAALMGGAIATTNSSSVKISHSTLVQNSTVTPEAGAGIDSGSSVSTAIQIKNSIVADSTQGRNCHSLTLTAFGKNFSTDSSCSGFSQVTLDELNLADLGHNRGRTESIALQSRSVAVDAAEDCTDLNNEVVEVDQRGIPRTHGEACDVGAFERIDNPSDFRVAPLSEAVVVNVVGEYSFPFICGETFEEGEEASVHTTYDTQIELFMPEPEKFLGIFPRPKQTASFVESIEITESDVDVPMPDGPVGVLARLSSGESMTLSCADLIAMPTQLNAEGQLIQSLNELIEIGDSFSGNFKIQSDRSNLRVYVTDKVTHTEIVPEDASYPAAAPEFIQERLAIFAEGVSYQVEVFLRAANSTHSSATKLAGASAVTEAPKAQFKAQGFHKRAILFTAQSAIPQNLSIEIYGLSGERVFASSTSGNSLMWHMRDNSGSLVANGVYLYVLKAVDESGNVTFSGVKKLVVLR